MQRTRIVGAALAGVVGLATLAPDSVSQQASSRSNEALPERAEPQGSLGSALADTTFPVYLSYEFSQLVDLIDNRTILVTQIEPGGVRVEYSYSSSFDLTGICSAGPNDFFVWGSDAVGNAVVERWELLPHAGSWHAARATGVLGTPSGNCTWDSTLVGGQAVPIEQRRSNPRLRRTVLYHGEDLHPIRVMNVDPEKRFVLLLTLDGALHQLELADGATPTLLVDSADLPGLETASSISRYHHVDGARVWTVLGYIGEGPPFGLVLRDLDNDGLLMDEILVGDPHETPGAFATSDVVADVFVHNY